MQPEAAVLKFLDLVDRDLASGGLRVVSSYVQQFPEHEERIRAEYELLVGQGDGAGGGKHEHKQGPEPARLIGGRYRVIESLGRGGFGEVFLADDLELERRLAVKMLTGLRAFGAEWRGRLIREAEVTNRIDDDGICPVHDVGFENGLPFLVMPWIRGRSLDRLISTAATTAKGEGPVSLPRAAMPQGGAADGLRARRDACLKMVEAVARTLHAAHQAGVVHRDVKPANILVRSDGRPILIDFGLARIQEGAANASASGALGTSAYSDPEALAESAAPDARLDVWSLGIVLFECLALRRPFAARAGRSLERCMAEEPVPRVDDRFGRDLQAVLEKALAPTRARRYPNMQAFAEDLARIQIGAPVAVRAAGPVRRLRAWARVRAVAVGAAIAATGLVAAGLLAAASLWLQDRKQALAKEQVAGYLAMAEEYAAEVEVRAEGTLPIGTRMVRIEGLLQKTRELHRSFAQSLEVERMLVDMLVRAAGLSLRLGQTERAVAGLTEGLQLIRRVAERSGGADRDRAKIAHILVLLGDAHSHNQELAAALQLFREAQQVDQALLGEQPEDATRMSNVAFGHLRTGHMLRQLGELDACYEHQRRAVAMLVQVEQLDSDNAARRWHAVDAMLVLSATLRERDPQDASGEFEQLLQQVDQRMSSGGGLDLTTAAQWRHMVSLTERRLVITEPPARRLELANEMLAAAQHAVELEPNGPYTRLALVSARHAMARELATSEQFAAAKEQMRLAIAASDLAVSMSPRAANPLARSVGSRALAAEIHAQAGEPDRAAQHLRDGLAIIERSFARPEVNAATLAKLGAMLLLPDFAAVDGAVAVRELVRARERMVGRLGDELRRLGERAEKRLR